MTSSSSDDDAAFDAFLASLKPVRKQTYRESFGSLEDFVVSDDHVSFDDASDDSEVPKSQHKTEKRNRINYKSFSQDSERISSEESTTSGDSFLENSISQSSHPDTNITSSPLESPYSDDESTNIVNSQINPTNNITSTDDSCDSNSNLKSNSGKCTLLGTAAIVPPKPKLQSKPNSGIYCERRRAILRNFTPKRSTASASSVNSKSAFLTPRLVFSSDSDSDLETRNKEDTRTKHTTQSTYSDVSVYGVAKDTSGSSGGSSVSNPTASVESLCSDFDKIDVAERTPSSSKCSDHDFDPIPAWHTAKKKSKALVLSDDSQSDDDVIYEESDSDKENFERNITDDIDFSSDYDDENDDVFATPVMIPKKTPLKIKSRNVSMYKTPVVTAKTSVRKDGLPSNLPSNCETGQGFKRHRDQLTQLLYRHFNKTIFEDKLPKDMKVEWHKRLLKTAGVTKCSTRTATVKENGVSCATKTYFAKICLSEKVLDTLCRLRDTLCHEMCHAAVWLIDCENDGHGPYWKRWARKAMAAHPDMPVVKRCHSYDISYKFHYQCTMCRKVYGRHSKSIKVDKQCCGVCKGRLVLLPPKKLDGTPIKTRQPNKFAMFVKENYKVTQKSHSTGGATPKHADVMKALSRKFAGLSANK